MVCTDLCRSLSRSKMKPLFAKTKSPWTLLREKGPTTGTKGLYMGHLDNGLGLGGRNHCVTFGCSC